MSNREDLLARALLHLKKDWALISAGTVDDFNTCTVSWGSFGIIWGKEVVTAYIHPSRYTSEFMKRENLFTVSLFPAEYKKALGILGSLSGRDGDKITPSGLTPVSWQGSVTFKEASITLLCRKLYQHSFVKDGLDKAILEQYESKPNVFPPDENGEVQPHIEFVGEIIDVLEID